MGVLADNIAAALTSSTPLTDVLVGGIHKQRFTRDGTPTAFGSAGVPLAAATVLDRGDDADLTGIEFAYGAFPQVWFQAPATADGRSDIDGATDLARSILHGRQIAGPNGTGADIRVGGRVGPVDDPTIAEALVTILRLQVAGVWQ